MENNHSIVNVNSVLPKIKNRKLLQEFCFELGYLLPDFTCFSHEFVFLWGAGRKNVRL